MLRLCDNLAGNLHTVVKPKIVLKEILLNRVEGCCQLPLLEIRLEAVEDVWHRLSASNGISLGVERFVYPYDGAARGAHEHLGGFAAKNLRGRGFLKEFVEGIHLAMRFRGKRIPVCLQPRAVDDFLELRFEREVRMPLCKKDDGGNVLVKRQSSGRRARRARPTVFAADKNRQRQIVEPPLAYPRLVLRTVRADKNDIRFCLRLFHFSCLPKALHDLHVLHGLKLFRQSCQ